MASTKDVREFVAWARAQGLNDEDLDVLVEDLCSKTTSDINNQGMVGQAKAILDCVSLEEAKESLRSEFCISKDAPVPEEVSANDGPTATVNITLRLRLKLPKIGSTFDCIHEYQQMVESAVNEIYYDLGPSVEVDGKSIDVVDTEILDTDNIRLD